MQSTKDWCLRTAVLEKTSESPLDSKEIKPVNLKGYQFWILIGRTDAEAEAPVFWSSDGNSWLIGKVSDAGKDWGQKEKRASEDEMAGWHHQWTWTWTWANSGRWWGTGRAGLLQSMGLQSVGHDWVTEQQQQYRYVNAHVGIHPNPPSALGIHMFVLFVLATIWEERSRQQSTEPHAGPFVPEKTRSGV